VKSVRGPKAGASGLDLFEAEVVALLRRWTATMTTGHGLSR